MKTITKNYTVYNYNELSDSAKDKVKQWYLDDPFRTDNFTECIEEDLKNLFPNSDLNVEYRLASCQGDGVNIYGDFAALDAVSLLANKGLTDKELKTAKNYLQYIDSFKLEPNNFYTYCICDRHDFENEIYFELENNQGYSNINEAVLKKMSDIFRDSLTDLCRQYEEQGYKYLYEVDEEEITDFCNANEYDFLEDGTFFSEVYA